MLLCNIITRTNTRNNIQALRKNLMSSKTKSSSSSPMGMTSAFALLVLPPIIVYNTYYKHNIDNREISEEEVQLSREMLQSLLPLSMETSREQSLDQIQNHGVIYIPKLLNKKQLVTWNRNLQHAIYDNGKGRDYNPSSKNRKSSRKPIRNNRGRLHSHQESKLHDPYNSHFHQLLSNLPQIQQMVQTYFAGSSLKYQLTQIQFLLAKPNSQHQIWHRDNTKPGLTLLISLSDVKANGPTELLLGSHREINDNNNEREKVLLACLEEGDAILYDARVIHRGRGYNENDHSYNNKKAEDRPVLIIRWDALSTPPPGAGFIMTNYIDILGSYKIFAVKLNDFIDQYLRKS